MIWGGRYIKFIVGLNPTRLDSSVVRASGICPEGLGSIPSLVTFLYSNKRRGEDTEAASSRLTSKLIYNKGNEYALHKKRMTKKYPINKAAPRGEIFKI